MSRPQDDNAGHGNNQCYSTTRSNTNDVSKEQNKKITNSNTLAVSREMCHYCFEVLLHELDPTHHERPTLPSCLSELQSTSVSCPLFVTWDKKRSIEDTRQEFDLRGCIGTLAPQPLVPALREYAITSAFRDRRFNPIEREEVPHLRVAVSLLVKYEDCAHCFDWEVGLHGVIIKFAHRTRQYSATYLPEVSKEQGWTQQETIHSLARKSGFTGLLSTELIDNIKCTRYQSSKDRVTYEDFVVTRGYDPFQNMRKERKRSVGWRTCMHL